jgi:DNA-binding IclR family transcriptional regulator
VVYRASYTRWEEATEKREGVSYTVWRLVEREFAMKTLPTDVGEDLEEVEGVLMEIAVPIYAHQHKLKGAVELHYVFHDVSLPRIGRSIATH